MFNDPFRDDNVTAYRLVLRIEIALRECLRESLETENGPSWRKLLPGELLKKIRQAQTAENRPNFDYLSLGPLYYLTLGEIIPILQQKCGRPTADRFGGEAFTKQLENILGPRNAMCHSRRAPPVGLQAIECLYRQMEVALTPSGLTAALATPDVGITPETAARDLLEWAVACRDSLASLHWPITEAISYGTAETQYWWGRQELAGFDTSTVEKLAVLIRSYNALPSGIGSIGLRQRFCVDERASDIADAAVAELQSQL